MKYCRSKDIRHTHLFVFCLLVFILIIMLRTLSDMSNDADTGWQFFILLMSVSVVVHGLYVLWQHRKYAISREGIIVAYISKLTRMIPWSSISEIAVCRLHYRTKIGYETVIRIAIDPESYGPGQGVGEWESETYSIKYQHRIILIDYSEKTLEEFKTVCPLLIRDYR